MKTKLSTLSSERSSGSFLTTYRSEFSIPKRDWERDTKSKLTTYSSEFPVGTFPGGS